jgi:hypothetical protein
MSRINTAVATQKERKKQIISLETCIERTISQCNFVLCSFPAAIIKVRKQRNIFLHGGALL